MIQITIRELHMQTGAWVRKVMHGGVIVVTDRKNPIAKLVPFTPEDQGKCFADRPLVEGFSALPQVTHDSTDYLSEDRGRK